MLDLLKIKKRLLMLFCFLYCVLWTHSQSKLFSSILGSKCSSFVDPENLSFSDISRRNKKGTITSSIVIVDFEQLLLSVVKWIIIYQIIQWSKCCSDIGYRWTEKVFSSKENLKRNNFFTIKGVTPYVFSHSLVHVGKKVYAK